MKRIIGMILAVTILLVTAACSSAGNESPGRGSADPQDVSSESILSGGQSQAAISLEKFKAEARRMDLGDIIEVNGDYGYDAALVTAEDGTNYIYMYLADPEMAKAVLTDSDDDGEMDPDFSLTKKGTGYELYTQESMYSSSSEEAVYGKCLLAGNMILMVSGAMENRDTVSNNADVFMKNLGYEI